MRTSFVSDEYNGIDLIYDSLNGLTISVYGDSWFSQFFYDRVVTISLPLFLSIIVSIFFTMSYIQTKFSSTTGSLLFFICIIILLIVIRYLPKFYSPFIDFLFKLWSKVSKIQSPKKYFFPLKNKLISLNSQSLQIPKDMILAMDYRYGSILISDILENEYSINWNGDLKPEDIATIQNIFVELLHLDNGEYLKPPKIMDYRYVRPEIIELDLFTRKEIAKEVGYESQSSEELSGYRRFYKFISLIGSIIPFFASIYCFGVLHQNFESSTLLEVITYSFLGAFFLLYFAAWVIISSDHY